MAQTQAIQRRIRSVKNAKQITKALEVVAASRMRRVVSAVEGARNYGDIAGEIMRRIASRPEAAQHPLFGEAAASGQTLYVVFTSDRGQAGAFNSNVFNLSLANIREERQKPAVIVFGRKGARFFAKLGGVELRGEFEDVADTPEINLFAPVLQAIQDGLADGQYNRVKLVYTQFVSSLAQKAAIIDLAPIDLSTIQDESEATVYEFEPEINDVLEEAIRLYFEAKLIQARIESAASEHAMRMMAMGNANRNATDLIDDLTLELNATRQAAITQEIAEITGGAEAIAA